MIHPESATARFGRAARSEWALDPAITYLNHGTVGAPPRRVLAAQQAIRDEIERQPHAFLIRETANLTVGRPRREPSRMRVAAKAVAEFLGARPDDVVFVDNATTGVNAVMRSLPLAAGDEVLVTDHNYGAVVMAASHAAGERGAVMRTVQLPRPVRSAESVVEAVARALTPRTRLLIVDHITAESALILPVAEIAALCHAAGVMVLVDGAHAPGAIAFDIPSLGVDWYTGNLHKWGWSPRSCGILWAHPERQPGLHPPVISWGYGSGFTAEFDWVGTRDPSPWLVAPEGIAMMREWGVEAVRAYNHDLAWRGAQHLAAAWGTRFETPEAMIGTMATVALPERAGSSKDDVAGLRDDLWFQDRIEIQMHAAHGRLHARLSGQVYNDLSEVERLAQAVLARIPR